MRDRRNLSPVLLVSVPTKENPELILQIERMAEAEKGFLVSEAALLTKGEALEPEAANALFILKYQQILFGRIPRKIKGWQHKPKSDEEPVAFSQKTLEEFLSSIDMQLATAIVNAYFEAADEDEQRAKKKDTSGTDSTTA